MTMDVIYLNDDMCGAWDDYVDHHPDGSFYHLSGWRQVIDRTFSHPSYFCCVLELGAIIAVLPLVHVKSRLFGNTLVSTPFCIQGGILANNLQAHQLLLDSAISLAQELGVDYVEFKPGLAVNERPELSKQEDTNVIFGCQLPSQSQDILATIKKKQRAVIRQSLANQLSYQIEHDVDNVYRIYSYSVRNLGSPVFSKALFKNLLLAFPKQCEILTVFHDDKAVSSVMSFYYRQRVIPHFGGGLFAARALKSNDFMYYQLMCHSVEQGYDYFDFGRSKIGSGAYQYKKHWGMTAEPADNQYYLHRANVLPKVNVNNPKYALAIKVWKKLPLPLSQLIGPKLSQYLG